MADSIVQNPACPTTHSLIRAHLNNAFVIVAFFLSGGRISNILLSVTIRNCSKLGASGKGSKLV